MYPSFLPNLPIKPLLLQKTQHTNTSPQTMQLRQKSNEGASSRKSDAQQKTSKQRGKRKTKTSNFQPMANPMFPNIAEGDSSSSSSSDSFTTAGPRRELGIIPNTRAEPISFNYEGRSPLRNIQLEDNYTPSNPFPSVKTDGVDVFSKLSINLAAYRNLFIFGDSVISRHIKAQFDEDARAVVRTIRSKIIDSWSFPNYLYMLRSVCELLEMFYFLDARRAFEASIDFPDRNTCLQEFRRMYSNYELSTIHDEARIVLQGCWFPQELAKLIRWTYQSYRTGEAAQAHNYIFCPSAKLLPDPYQSTEDFDTNKLIDRYQELIDAVTTTNNRNLFSILSQTFPGGEINNLPDSCNRSVYDEKHLEAFMNQGIVLQGANFINVGWPQTEQSMYACKREPDQMGVFPYVLNTTFDTTRKIFNNGVLQPVLRNTLNGGVKMPEGDWYFKTNKFFCQSNTASEDKFTVFPRNTILYRDQNPTLDVHQAKLITSSLKVPDYTGSVSQCVGEYQAMYFNTKESRLIVVKEFLNFIFGSR